MNDFSPRTTQENERQIVRLQKDFSAGVYKDIPATNIPDNGIAELKNFINKGYELVGRSGSRKWGDYSTGIAHASLPTLKGPNILTSTSDGSNRTVLSADNIFTSDDIGRFVVLSDGSNERIINYVSAGSVITETTNTNNINGYGYVRGQINGLYFHTFLKKIILIIDTEVYVSEDISISSWIKAYNKSYRRLENKVCSIDEKDNYIIIGNASGIYRLNIDVSGIEPYYYYKINSDVPSAPLTKVAKTSGDIYSRRYIYSLCNMKIANINDNRMSAGSILYTETGTNKADSTNLDYSDCWTVNPISASNPNTVSGFTLPGIEDSSNKEKHFTHYSIWATTDCGVNGTDPVIGTATNTEQYIWVDDIPIMKPFVCNISSITVKIVKGTVSKKDIGSVLRTIDSGDQVVELTITGVDETLNTYTVASYSHTYTLTDIPASLGASNTANITVTDFDGINKFTIEVTKGNLFVDSDEGKSLRFPDGNTAYISNVLSITTAEILSEIYVNDSTVCWNENTRSYCDYNTDDVLRGRISDFPCYQRFFDRIPGENSLVCYSNGFLFSAERNKNYIFYSQVPDGFDYLMGYYHPAYQLSHVKDGIRLIKPLLDRVVVYAYNSTYVIPVNTYSSVTYEDLGVYIAVVPTVTTIDDTIGCVSYGSVQSLEKGNHILITNEPALRIFNGQTYSENLASHKMMETLKSLQQNMSSIYSSYTGYLVWGLDE